MLSTAAIEAYRIIVSKLMGTNASALLNGLPSTIRAYDTVLS